MPFLELGIQAHHADVIHDLLRRAQLTPMQNNLIGYFFLEGHGRPSAMGFNRRWALNLKRVDIHTSLRAALEEFRLFLKSRNLVRTGDVI